MTIDVQDTSVSDGTPATIKSLIYTLKTNYLTEREEFFVDNDGISIRPGILVLVDDVDWELVDKEDYALKEGDTIAFISTLHGG